jgi:hypothetical protein
MKRSSWQVRAAAAVIFLLGFAAGALALNAYRAWRRADVQPTQQDRFRQLSERLQLSAEQQMREEWGRRGRRGRGGEGQAPTPGG